MTQPKIPPTSASPEPSERELLALYHEASDAEPGPLLDQRILAAAHAELQTERKGSRPSAPWWRAFLIPATTVAVGLLGVSLAWRVADQQEQDLRAAMSAVELPRNNANQMPDPLPQPEAANGVAPAAPAPDVRKPLVEAKGGSTPVPVKPPQAFPAQQGKSERAGGNSEAPMLDAAKSAAAPLAAPMPAQGTLGKARPAEAEAAQIAGESSESRNDAASQASTQEVDKASEAGRSAVQSPVRSEARALAKESAKKGAEKDAEATRSAPGLADDAATPEAWLTHVRELRSAGRDADAALSLARFRLRYPDQVIPNDLIDLK